MNSLAFRKKRQLAISCDALHLPLPQPYRHDGSPCFYLAIRGPNLPARMRPYRTCDNPRRDAMKRDLGHLRSKLATRCTDRPSDCGTRADRSTATRRPDERSGCRPCDDRSPKVWRAVRRRRVEIWSAAFTVSSSAACPGRSGRARRPTEVDPSPDDGHSVQILHCRRRGPGRTVAIVELADDRRCARRQV